LTFMCVCFGVADPELELTRVLRKAPRSDGWGAGCSGGEGEAWNLRHHGQ
jgi:hypothetical protein